MEADSSKAVYELKTFSKKALMLAPPLIVSAWAALLVNPSTRAGALWMLRENHPAELLTFAVALGGGILGLFLAWRAVKSGERTSISLYYAMFASALIFVGMEEIAWGQQFLGFDSPDAWRSLNAQGETTLHNVVGLQGRSEIFRLLFGAAGLAAVRLSFYSRFRKIGSPSVLLPWFITITLHAGVDVYNDFVPIGPQFDYYMQRTSELIELLIVLAGFLYLALNWKMLSNLWKLKKRQTC